MDSVADFMDCSIVIPPTEIQNEAMLNSIISFQKKLLQDRFQSSESKLRRDSRPRRGESYQYTIRTTESIMVNFGFYTISTHKQTSYWLD